MTGIQQISPLQAEALVEAWVNYIDIPKDRWYCYENKKYIAIDNQSGDCWVEEFDTAKEALEWLIF